MFKIKNNSSKIRLLKSLKHTNGFSLYKISLKDNLEWNSDSISFKNHPEIRKENIISISKFVPGGLNFESWIKIEFTSKEGQKKEIYIISRRLLGFGSFLNDNEQIESELKNKYLNS